MDRTGPNLSKILQITHSQWIYNNILFNNEEKGYPRQREIDVLKCEVKEIACTNPAELPAESILLLEMNG